MAKRYFIQLSYDGTHLHGWQIQPNAKSIQETLNEALCTLLRTNIYTIGCGRTDTGVHASFFVAHMDIAELVLSENELVYKLNRLLPESIAIQQIFEVDPTLHARFSALSRTYHYHITSVKNPFTVNRKWELREVLDLNRMNESAKFLLGEHDFSCFSKSNTQTETNICRVSEAFWTRISDSEIVFTISANRFLRNMVRAIVGTLVEVGKGKMDITDIKDILDSKNRSEAGTSVPAHGLYLTNVIYPTQGS